MVDRDASGRWVKGAASPNPGGRAKIVGDLRDLAREHTEAALATLVAIMGDETAPSAARVAAAGHVLDRGYGKPAAAVDARIEVAHSVADTAAQVLMALTRRARERQAEAARLIEVTGEAVE